MFVRKNSDDFASSISNLSSPPGDPTISYIMTQAGKFFSCRNDDGGTSESKCGRKFIMSPHIDIVLQLEKIMRLWSRETEEMSFSKDGSKSEYFGIRSFLIGFFYNMQTFLERLHL